MLQYFTKYCNQKCYIIKLHTFSCQSVQSLRKNEKEHYTDTFYTLSDFSISPAINLKIKNRGKMQLGAISTPIVLFYFPRRGKIT